MPEKLQLQLNFGDHYMSDRMWPDVNEFPLNIDRYNRNAEYVIQADISNSKKFTIINGFTSLSYLIDTFGKNDHLNLDEVRIVLGFEPVARGRKKYYKKPLDVHIKEYWLGVEKLSILKGGSVINLIEKIKSKKIVFKI